MRKSRGKNCTAFLRFAQKYYFILRQVKKESIILGIDPGTNVMGFGVLRIMGKDAKVIDLGVEHFGKYPDHHTKLKHIFEASLKLVEEYLPDHLAVEAPFYGKNVQSMLKLGRAQGVVMAAAMYRDVPVAEYSPRKIKQSITGRGAASKEQLAILLEKTFQRELRQTFLDATDGLAVALCHHYQLSGLQLDSKGGSWEQFLKNNPGKISGN